MTSFCYINGKFGEWLYETENMAVNWANLGNALFLFQFCGFPRMGKYYQRKSVDILESKAQLA